MTFYQEYLLEHYRAPRNSIPLKTVASINEGVKNMSCGDAVSVSLTLDGDLVKDVYHQSTGCIMSIAYASIMSEKIKGMDLDTVLKLDATWVLELVPISLGPTRLRCALLFLEAVKRGVEKYKGVSSCSTVQNW